MGKDILLISNYQDRFGTKYTAKPYRSGLRKDLIESYFKKSGYNPEFINPARIINDDIDHSGKFILYTSSEDKGSHYKIFLDEVLYYLHSKGAILIPSYDYFKAHNSKTFMELVCKRTIGPSALDSRIYGTLEDIISDKSTISYPIVLKSAEGYKSRGVFLARNEDELLKYAARISRTKSIKYDFKDALRRFKHRGFVKESKNRSRFISQQFVPLLENDWKVLIYGNKYYVLYRKTGENDFRASGSGLFSHPESLPEGLLDYCEEMYNLFNVPQASFDIVSDGSRFYMVEVQFVYFGTYTLEFSNFWFEKANSKWERKLGISILEEEYCRSITTYLEKSK